MEYYRLQIISEGKIELEKGKEGNIKSVTGAGGAKEEEFARLSEIIKILNEKFGTDFTDADQLFFNQIEEDLISNESLKQKAQVNTIDNFKFGFEDIFLTILVDRMSQNQDIFTKIMNDETFAKTVKEYLMKKVYKRLNEYTHN